MPLVLAFLLAAAACTDASAPQPVAATPSPGTVFAGQTLAVTVEGRKLAVPVALDAATIDPKGDHEVRVLASRGNVVILLDSYASRPQSMSRCQAGTERWLRVIDMAASRERYARLVESCLKDVVAGDPLVSGPDAAGSITVNMASEPSFRVTADGRLETMQ